MRFYSFNNMYLSSIQVGIQTGHVIGEMFNNYGPQLRAMADSVDFTVTEQFTWLNEWSRNHKTMILLNGGYGKNLRDLNVFFFSAEHGYPYASFSESREALDGAITSVGIILPPKIYDGARLMQKTKRLPRDMNIRQLFERENILVFDSEDGKEEVQYTQWEVELMERLNSFRLAQ